MLGLPSASVILDVQTCTSSKKLLVQVDNKTEISRLKPNFKKMTQMSYGSSLPQVRGVIVTSRDADSEYDFLSRYFLPWAGQKISRKFLCADVVAGVDEDPVTGSAHCVLAVYWSKILSKKRLSAFQVCTMNLNTNTK